MSARDESLYQQQVNDTFCPFCGGRVTSWTPIAASIFSSGYDCFGCGLMWHCKHGEKQPYAVVVFYTGDNRESKLKDGYLPIWDISKYVMRRDCYL